MDELSMVRRLLAEPPPSPDVVAAGRERLLRSPRATGRAAVRSAPALGLTAALVAAVLMVAAPGHGGGTSPGGGGLFLADASARNVLLAAAAHAQAAPASGTYWHVRSLSTTTLQFGRGAGRYALEHLTIHETWTKRDGRAWSGSREWVRPKTARDEAAWRRDGAPSRWCTGRTDTEPPERLCLHTAPGRASLTQNPFPFELAEEHELTFGQLQRLPRDADALRAWLVGITRHDLDPSASAGIVDDNVDQILADLLVYPPVPPGVRAAAFRALADMPNVTSTGPARDALGRPGIGIEIAEGEGWFVPGAATAAKLTRTLIIDPGTSHVLADEARIGNRADPVSDTLVVAVGWTSEGPHEPALP